MEAFRLMPRHRTTSRRSWPTPRTTGARPLRPPPLHPTRPPDSRTRPPNPPPQNMKTTGTPAAEWPPGGAGSTTSTASPRRAPTDFGALLDQHQARTAVAEGPKKKEAPKPEHHKLERKSDKDEASAPAPHRAESKAPAAKPEGTAPATEQQQPAKPDGRQDEQGDQPTVETPVVAVDPLV